MIQVTSTIALDESDIEITFVRSSGPGGQNVNKVATAAQLRFDAAHSRLPSDVRARLLARAGSRVTREGVVVMTGRRFRTQERNRDDVIARLVELIRSVATPPRPRRKTRLPHSAKVKRVDAKRRRSTTKRLRRPVTGED